MWLFSLLFALTALVYATVGFGGGSTYNALLALHGVDYRLYPFIALACNIIVAGGGSWRFLATGNMRLSRAAPFFITSIPLAWIGGRLSLEEGVFTGLLAGSLFLIALVMLGQRPNSGQLAKKERAPKEEQEKSIRRQLILVDYGVGGLIGLLSGMIGIGGGVLLAPFLYLTNWGKAREIVGTASLFIFANSLAGLIGQGEKLMGQNLGADLLAFWPLPFAVLLGGQIGSRLASGPIPEIWIRRITALLILFVSLRLAWRWFAMQ